MAFWNRTKPELISIHIPKTAGTSFRNILKSVYGQENVVRFDISMRGVIRLNEQLYNDKKLPAAKVLHGHFSYQAIKSGYEIDEACPIITWVRDPVQRVISNFLYLESRLIAILQEEKNNLQILEKMQKSLPEFARTEINRNRQSKFLEGIAPEKLKFIGVTERFEQDINELASVLNWGKIPETLYHNITETTPREFPSEVLEEVRDLNMKDVALYEHVLKMRNLR